MARAPFYGSLGREEEFSVDKGDGTEYEERLGQYFIANEIMESRSKAETTAKRTRRTGTYGIPCALLAYRSAKQSSTGLSPFKLTYGREARLPANVTMGLPKEPVRLTTKFP